MLTPRTAIALCCLALSSALIPGCTHVSNSPSGGDLAAGPGSRAPEDSGGRADGAEPPFLPWQESLSYEATGPYRVALGDVPARVYDPNNKLDRGRWGKRMDAPIPDEEADRRRGEALGLAPSRAVQAATSDGPLALASPEVTAFEALDYLDCCGGGGNVPPDPEVAVGPNHIIAVVNTAFAIYDKNGSRLTGPTTFTSFFAGTSGCTATSLFDPNVLYDEEADRFVIAADGNGDYYCVAASTGPNPTGTWNRYSFLTKVNGASFDYPHAGVGRDAIYLGANLFAGFFAEARVWAMDKYAMYAGQAMSVVTKTTGLDDTPQPANLHGFLQGTWPTGGPHYIITSRGFDGRHYEVYAWDDPFGANTLVDRGTVDLQAATGVTAGYPIDAPQNGAGVLQANDYRPQDTEYRNGRIWTTQTISCNPGVGTVNCVRWAEIEPADPAGPTVLDAGVFASNDAYRFFSDLAVNHCDDMGIGYTKSSPSMYPSVWVAGRESTDPPGVLQPETEVKAGEVAYTAFDHSPFRWGDYTAMTIDPDGETFWYLGQYSKNTGTTSGRWGTAVGSFRFSCTAVAAECGNDLIDGNEVCDGTDLGGETCLLQGCVGGGSLACNATCEGFDTSACSGCPVCDNDGVCEPGEDCDSCPGDCVSGQLPGAACGNGTCEAADGENCLTCPNDCNGKQSGKRSKQFCCGDGGGQGPVPCGDARCTASGLACTSAPVPPGASFCCGDLTCDDGESCANCAVDCTSVTEVCDDGIDNDCDGSTDCADSDCGGAPICQCAATETSCSDGVDNDCDGPVDCADSDCNGAAGCCLSKDQSCSSNGDCCSGSCRRKGGVSKCR